MSEILTPHNESLMPLRMGSPIRVPDYAYRNWGLTPIDEARVLDAYLLEWESGTNAQLDLVSQASKAAGFGDYPELLRQETAKAVALLVKQNFFKHGLIVLDIGAGPGLSAAAIVDTLPKNQNLQMLLVEPSAVSLEKAGQEMEKRQIPHQLLKGTDIDMLSKMEESSVDILTGVASIHHHSKIPFVEYARVLKPGGFAIFADWHHDLWEHPNRVLEFLGRFDWPHKSAGLTNWINTYARSQTEADRFLSLHPDQLMAREQITKFWLAYKTISDQADLGNNAIWPLEGHRPVNRYLEEMDKAGLSPYARYKLLTNSSLLQVSMGRKTEV